MRERTKSRKKEKKDEGKQIECKDDRIESEEYMRAIRRKGECKERRK